MADVPVSALQTHVIQLEATICSAHALLQAGLIGDATSLLGAFSTEVQPNIDRELTEVRITQYFHQHLPLTFHQNACDGSMDSSSESREFDCF